MRKEKQVHLYMSAKDHDTVKRKAQEKNMSTNEFIRYCIAHYIDNSYTRNYIND